MKKSVVIILSMVCLTAVYCKKKDSKSSPDTTTGSTTGNPSQTFEQVIIGSGSTSWKSTTLCGYPPCVASIPAEPCFIFNSNYTSQTPTFTSTTGSNCNFEHYDNHTWQVINDNGSSAKLVTDGSGTITISSYNASQFILSNGCTYVKQ